MTPPCIDDSWISTTPAIGDATPTSHVSEADDEPHERTGRALILHGATHPGIFDADLRQRHGRDQQHQQASEDVEAAGSGDHRCASRAGRQPFYRLPARGSARIAQSMSRRRTLWQYCRLR